MAVGGVSGANTMMADMMRVLMQGMQQQTQLAKEAVAVDVQNDIIADKMDLAQQIIDAYA